jgi:5-methylcytosine-specific restriction endonuclease McrA
MKEYSKEWNEKNEDLMKVRLKNFQENNPEKLMEYREKRKHKIHNITEEEWENCKKYFDYTCAYCGLPLSEHYKIYKEKLKHYDFSKDHAIDRGANDLSNCVPSCSSCNSSKHTLNLDEWYDENNPVYISDRHDKIIKWLQADYSKFQEG